LEDFIDQEVTSLFIIELEDIGNLLEELRLRISSLALGKKKKKYQRWNMSDFNC
jgi:hypothetical protein